MPSATSPAIGSWITRHVSPAAAVLTVIDAVVAFTTTRPAIEMFETVNPFWIYAVAYFSVVVPLSFAVAPVAGRMYRVAGDWWTRDERLFDSVRGIVGQLWEIESGLAGDHDMALQGYLEDDLHSRLTALHIRTDVNRSDLFTEVLYGTLRRARKL